MWVDYMPVDVEVDHDNTRIFHIFELRIGINEFDHRSFFIATIKKIPVLSSSIPTFIKN